MRVSVDDVSVELRFFCRRFQQLGLLYRLLAAKRSLQRRDEADELLVAAPQQREQLLLRELEQPLLEGQDLRVSH